MIEVLKQALSKSSRQFTGTISEVISDIDYVVTDSANNKIKVQSHKKWSKRNVVLVKDNWIIGASSKKRSIPTFEE